MLLVVGAYRASFVRLSYRWFARFAAPGRVLDVEKILGFEPDEGAPERDGFVGRLEDEVAVGRIEGDVEDSASVFAAEVVVVIADAHLAEGVGSPLPPEAGEVLVHPREVEEIGFVLRAIGSTRLGLARSCRGESLDLPTRVCNAKGTRF